MMIHYQDKHVFEHIITFLLTPVNALPLIELLITFVFVTYFLFCFRALNLNALQFRNLIKQ